MQLPALVGLVLATSGVVFADEKMLGDGKTMREPCIAKIFPDDYAAYERKLIQSNGTNDANAVIELLANVKKTVNHLPYGAAKDQDCIAAYRAAWCLCLRVLQESKDEHAHQLILDKWNDYLREDDEAVPSQIYALVKQWDRKLLTDVFWKTLQQTKNKKTVSAIGYALYQKGNMDDLNQLINVEKQTRGCGLPNAISWLRYRLSGDMTNPGPAAAPPRME